MDIFQELALRFDRKDFALYEVGGSVRDSILGKSPTDFDFTTNASPQAVKSLVKGLGDIYDIGEAFGTIGLKLDNGNVIEITTFRKEVYPSDSRKPNVEFNFQATTEALIQDLSRRDFTINSIARDVLTGEVIDPFNGTNDIREKVIKCVGNDQKRFNEDPLRMMRAIRFACQLKFYLDVHISNPERLSIISKERIRDELSKILLTKRASSGVLFLCTYGLMKNVIPDFIELQLLNQGKHHVKDAFRHSLMVLAKGTKIDFGDDNLIFRLACLLHDISKPETKFEDETGIHFYSHQYVGAKKTERILSELKYDNNTIERARELVYFHMSPLMLYKGYEEGDGLTKRSVMRLIRKVGEENISLLLALVKCDMRSSKNARREFLSVLTNLVNECVKEKPSEIVSPLNGIEIMSFFGLKPSPIVGQLKEFLTNQVIDGKLNRNDKVMAVVMAREKFAELINDDEDSEFD